MANNKTAAAAASYTVRATIATSTPLKTATAFSFLLAAEKGYTSEIVCDGLAHIVVASDGQAVRFAPEGK